MGEWYQGNLVYRDLVFRVMRVSPLDVVAGDYGLCNRVRKEQ